jgi:hypothetical protein
VTRRGCIGTEYWPSADHGTEISMMPDGDNVSDSVAGTCSSDDE